MFRPYSSSSVALFLKKTDTSYKRVGVRRRWYAARQLTLHETVLCLILSSSNGMEHCDQAEGVEFQTPVLSCTKPLTSRPHNILNTFSSKFGSTTLAVSGLVVMVVMVSRRSSVAWVKLSLHLDDEVRPLDSELRRGVFGRGFVGNVGSVVGGVWERFGERLLEPVECAMIWSTLCSQKGEGYASSGIVPCEELDRGSKISYRSLLCGKKDSISARLPNRDIL